MITIEMARDAILMWLGDAENKHDAIPSPSKPHDINIESDSFINLIDTDTDIFCRGSDAIKKTLSIPNWLNTKAEKAGINFSQTLQKALKKELGIE